MCGTYAVAQYAVCCYSRGLSVVCMYSVIFVDPILVIKIMMEVGEGEKERESITFSLSWQKSTNE